MTHQTRSDLIARDSLLKLLTDEEMARVSTAETGSSLTAGQEYIDLEHLDKGVQIYNTAANVVMSNALPRRAVGDPTWSNIITQLGMQPTR
jgi:hypothetical protein